MTTPDVAQIMVAGQRTGIIDLKAVLEAVAGEFQGSPDEQIKAELLARLSKTNYIIEKLKDEYGIAFLREYKRFVGEPFEEPLEPGFVQVRVLGQGCPNCDRLEGDLMTLLAEMQIKADLEHVRDPIAISEYGVMSTPGLIINGQVKAVGKVPSKAVLKTWLIEAAGE